MRSKTSQICRARSTSIRTGGGASRCRSTNCSPSRPSATACSRSSAPAAPPFPLPPRRPLLILRGPTHHDRPAFHTQAPVSQGLYFRRRTGARRVLCCARRESRLRIARDNCRAGLDARLRHRRLQSDQCGMWRRSGPETAGRETARTWHGTDYRRGAESHGCRRIEQCLVARHPRMGTP